MVRVQDFWEASYYKAHMHWQAGLRATKPTAAAFHLTRERARALAASADQVIALLRPAQEAATPSLAVARPMTHAATRSLSARSLAKSKIGTRAGTGTLRSTGRQVCAGTARTLAVPAVLALALSVREVARRPLKVDLLLQSEAADACDERRSTPADL